MKHYFITATDTDAGKTTVALHLLQQAASAGLETAALKPLACGGIETPVGLRNQDALLLQQAATIKKSYREVNPILYPEPCSPNIAASKHQQRISAKQLADVCQSTLQSTADYVLIEGCGGWLVPLNERETSANWVKLLNIQVILVVGVKLGCLNHAILTARALRQDGVSFAGWIANCVDDTFEYREECIATLQQFISEPLLETVPFMLNADEKPSNQSKCKNHLIQTE